MLDYVTNDTVCRSRMLLRYFGESNGHDCGQCDTCISLRNRQSADKRPAKELFGEILQILSEQEMTPAALAEKMPGGKEALTEALHLLLEEGKIIAANGMLQIKK